VEGLVYRDVAKYSMTYTAMDNAHNSLDSIKSIIDEAVLGRACVYGICHSVFNNTGALGGIDISKLTEIVDYAISKNVDIITVDELYELLNNNY
jgi:hypothetical protein